MDSFLATWRRISIENEDAFHKAVDIPAAVLEGFKKNADKARFTVSKDGDNFIHKIDCPGMPAYKMEFKLGVPFTTKDMLGFDSNVCIKFEGGKVVETRSSPGKYEMTITSIASGNTMNVVQTIGNVTATSVWEKC